MQANPAGGRVRAFVGRTREIAALSSALDAANGGRGTLCLISGEPGIGKSRLLVEFAAEQASRYPSIHWGFAWEAGGAPVYWPWIQILRSLLSRDYARATLQEQPHLAAAIGELVPELVPAAHRNGARLEPEQARFRLMDAVSSLLLACAAHEPLVLVLEDLHAVDTDSLSLAGIRGSPVARSRAPRSSARFAMPEIHRPRIGNIVARLRRAAIQLPLRRLDRDEIREYVRVATGERPLEQDVTGLATLTEGHPLYLAEVVELGLERGNLHIAPPSIRVTVLERAAQLPPQTRTLLGMASVLGRGFQPAALAEIAGFSEADLQAALAPALASGLLETGHGRWTAIRAHAGARGVSRCAAGHRTAHAARARGAAHAFEAEHGATVSWAALAQHFEESREHGGRGSRRCLAQRGLPGRSAAFVRRRGAVLQPRAAILGDTASMHAARARLMLELAAAQIRAGDLEAGRRNSSEAFRIGESLDDAEPARGRGAHLRQHLHFWQRRSAAGRPVEDRAHARRRRRHGPPRATAGAAGRGHAAGRRSLRTRRARARCDPARAYRAAMRARC